MFTHRAVVSAVAVLLAVGPAGAADVGPNLGRPMSAEDLSPWAINVFPSGKGLPAGSGTAAKGADVFAAHCAACHGDKGQGGLAPALITDLKRKGIDEGTVTIANYWPYATTVFDYVRRAMPWQSPRSLTDEEVYSLTAFILAKNGLIPEDKVVDAQSLPKVRMPNVDGFIVRFPQLTPPNARPLGHDTELQSTAEGRISAQSRLPETCTTPGH